MVREVITLNVGQAGVALGQTIWNQYNMEHSISLDGQRDDFVDDDSLLEVFYNHNSNNTHNAQYEPRNLMIDLEPESIDNIKTSKFAKLFNPQHLLSHKDGADGIFARGHRIGKQLIDEINDALRLIVEDCDNVQGFFLNNSVGGGTGSSLGSLILERIAVDYRKKTKFGFPIYPFNNNYSNNYCEAYNALLATSFIYDNTEQSFIYDNRKLFDLCKNKLHIGQPTYFDINNLISKTVSSITDPLRFEGIFNIDLNEFQRNGLHHAPHFNITAIAPLINKQSLMRNKKVLVDGFVRQYQMLRNDFKLKQYQYAPPPLYQDVMNMIYTAYDIGYHEPKDDIYEISDNVCNSEYFSIDCPDFDVEEDLYLEISINYRGDVKAKEVNAAFQWLKTNKKITLWEGCGPCMPNALWQFVMLNEVPPAMSEDFVMSPTKRNVVMIAKNTCMSRFFSERISKIYDRMYSQRAFVHWYVGEGMEEGEFSEARESLGFLQQDYLDFLYEQETDELEEESD